MADPVKDDCQWNGLAGECTPEDLRALAHGRNVRVTLPDPEPFTQEEP